MLLKQPSLFDDPILCYWQWWSWPDWRWFIQIDSSNHWIVAYDGIVIVNETFAGPVPVHL